MAWIQREIRLNPRPRGLHLITDEILHQVPEIRDFQIGLVHIFMKHTSASLALNENADPTVRVDMEAHLNKMVPENAPYYLHTYEGPDDMPAHIKAVFLGADVTVPVRSGRLSLGTWQGIYLCEHRNRGGGRKLTVTIFGETRSS